MNIDVEDLLRDSLQRQAGRAVPPERVLAGVPGKAAARTVRRWWAGSAMAASALLVAAIVITPTLLRQPSQAGTSLPFGGQSGTSEPPVSALMQYDLTWIPAGLLERVRSVPPDGADAGPYRSWSAAPVDATMDIKGTRLELYVWHGNPTDPTGERVTINGRTGYYVSAGSKSYVQWTVPGGVILNLAQHGGISKADLLHAARSVRPSTDLVEVPVAVGWLPQGFVLDYAEVSGNSPTFYRLSRIGNDTSPDPRSPLEQKRSPMRDISIAVAPLTDAPAGGEAVTVGGRPGRYIAQELPQAPGAVRYFVVVDLGGGRLLTVSGFGPWTRADLLHVADQIQVGPNPDLSWLGTR